MNSIGKQHYKTVTMTVRCAGSRDVFLGVVLHLKLLLLIHQSNRKYHFGKTANEDDACILTMEMYSTAVSFNVIIVSSPANY